MKTFTFFSDPAHGWLKVAAADLAAVDLTLNDISAYSYIGNDGAIYLEEDGDASKFIQAYKAKHGAINFSERHTNGQSHIRRMKHNEPGNANAATVTAALPEVQTAFNLVNAI